MFNIYHFYSNDLEIFISIIIINLIILFIYNQIKSHGKLELYIKKPKVTILNKNSWSVEGSKTDDLTKAVEVDFIFQIFNNKNTYNCIYNLELQSKKNKLANNTLNLVGTMKSFEGATIYEKLKYVNLLPYEFKEFHLKIKLSKDEFNNLKKDPIYIFYKTKKKKQKINLTKYLLSDKK